MHFLKLFFLLVTTCFLFDITIEAKPNKRIPSKQVTYEDFGAKGDGVTNDFQAIVKAHSFANKNKLPVFAKQNATYYIGGDNITAEIQTNTTFGNANFIIDDSNVENRGAAIFTITSTLQEQKINLKKLSINQKTINIKLPQNYLFIVENSNVKNFIRAGGNQNNGTNLSDIFIVNHKGNIDNKTPIIWQFDEITKINALPIDTNQLKISGGIFTTIANQEEGTHKYYHRGINIRRSNVIIEKLQHKVIDKSEHSFPYLGFIHISRCANIIIKDGLFTGRKPRFNINKNGKSIKTGTYDFLVNQSVNISFINCKQHNDIHDNSYWGIMGSNQSKNIIYNNCELSRFDAHMGVHNATIRNSKIGHAGITVVGSGKLTLENTTVRSRNLITLRSDYGSSWNGEFIIKNCKFIPVNKPNSPFYLINGSNSENHYFGYQCQIPKKILIDGLVIYDDKQGDKYKGPILISRLNNNKLKQSSYPYIMESNITIKNSKSTSGLKFQKSDSNNDYPNIKIIEK